jgi:transposase
MAKPLSPGLRERLIAVIAAGTSRRAAAARCGVAPSAAIEWWQLWRETGSVAPRAQGGDRRSDRIGARGAAIPAQVKATPDITLTEIAAHLERERGARFAPSTVRLFFCRHGLSFKKSPATQRNRPGRTSPSPGPPGPRRSPASTRSG